MNHKYYGGTIMENKGYTFKLAKLKVKLPLEETIIEGEIEGLEVTVENMDSLCNFLKDLYTPILKTLKK